MQIQHSLVAAALLLGTAMPAFAVAPTGDPVLYWNEVLFGPSYNPGQGRPSAMLSIALHDAVNATVGRPNRPYLGPIATNGGDTRAAAAVAAHTMLVAFYPARTAEFDAALAGQLALVPDGTAKTNGMATGATIAAATFANRTNDGSAAIVPYTPSGLPGRWAPTPPGFLPATAPQNATMKTWLGMVNDQFRAGPPPLITSLEYAAAFAEVRDLGSATSLLRTPDQTQSALFWASAAGPGPWVRAFIDQSELRGFSTIDNAAKLGLLNTALADSGIAVWDTKYHYDYWRPVTAIRAADLDGNPLTDVDPTWTPLIVTPPHPSYASAHAISAGVASTMLDDMLGTNVPFCVTAAAINRCWSSFDSAALDAANSRLWGGIHWSFDNATGLGMGRQVGDFALASNAFAAVPEPATWTLMIAGFGLVGLASRRRRGFASA